MPTHTSIVKVYDSRSGKWVSRAKVVLSWNGIINLGMSKDVYTDSNGVAEIAHASTGTATIYVNGTERGTMPTPSSHTVYI